MTKGVIALLLLGAIAAARAFPDNVPATSSTCKEMTPGHGDGAQKSPSPFQVQTSATRMKPGGQIEVIIKGSTFRGFYIQARDSEGNPVGSFLPNKLAETHSCFGKKSNAAHHTNRTPKTSLPIFWKAPPNYTGKVTFTATVVKDFATYWTFIKSKPVDVQTVYHNSSPGKVVFTDGSYKSKRSERTKVKRARIMNRKPIFESSTTDAPNTFQPEPATNYQVQVSSPYEDQHNNYQRPTSSQIPPHTQPQSIQLSTSYSIVKPRKPVRNRLSNVGFISPDFIDDFEQNQSRPLQQFPPYSYDHQKLPERKVNYQIQIKPSHHRNSKPKLERPSKQIQTSTAYNHNYVSQLAPISEPFPLQSPKISKFNPPQPLFGFRPNFYPFPLESAFHQRRGAFQKSGSFHFPSLPAHLPYLHDDFQHLDRQGGIHLPTYGYLIFNPKRGPPFYIIPEHPFELGLDNEFHPSHNELQSSVIKPRKLS